MVGNPKKDMWKKHNSNWLDKNPQNRNTKGRPRKLVSDVIANMEAKGIKPVSMDEIKDIYLRLVNNTWEELQEIWKDPNQPMLTKLIIQAMVNKGRGFEVIERMFDRAIGRAVQRSEYTWADGSAVKVELTEKQQWAISWLIWLFSRKNDGENNK